MPIRDGRKHCLIVEKGDTGSRGIIRKTRVRSVQKSGAVSCARNLISTPASIPIRSADDRFARGSLQEKPIAQGTNYGWSVRGLWRINGMARPSRSRAFNRSKTIARAIQLMFSQLRRGREREFRYMPVVSQSRA